jgi:sec-independent protein translocase protein TatC
VVRGDAARGLLHLPLFRQADLRVLVQPLLAAGQGKLIYTDIFEAFFVEVKVAFFAALMISFPVLATQIWRFVAPGLYAKEKKAFLPFLLMTPFFFAAGPASPISSPCRGR